jgi:outer membrane protein OmpA-like peptidoglycan-associated protein
MTRLITALFLILPLATHTLDLRLAPDAVFCRDAVAGGLRLIFAEGVDAAGEGCQWLWGFELGAQRAQNGGFTFLNPHAALRLAPSISLGTYFRFSPFAAVGAGYAFFENESGRTDAPGAFAASGLHLSWRLTGRLSLDLEGGGRAFLMREMRVVNAFASLGCSFRLGGTPPDPAVAALFSRLKAAQSRLPANPDLRLALEDGRILISASAYRIGRAACEPETAGSLEVLAGVIAQERGGIPDLIIRITGHGDASGGERLNEALSLARAHAIERLLTEGGIPAAVLSCEGRGSREARAAAVDAADRRVEIRIGIR